MNTILVDTSVWINVFKGLETKSSLFLKHNNNDFIIATCPVIVQEVLQGIVSDQQYTHLANYFRALEHLPGDQYLLAEESAKMYRKLRKHGITVRKPNDCLIAMFAIKNDMVLLEDDRDFKMIAKYTSLKLLNTNDNRV